jgi:hypothetical protein
MVLRSPASRIVLDRSDLGGMVGEGPLEGGKEVLRHDLRKRRGLERGLPRLQKRVCLGLRAGRHFRGFRHQDFPLLVPNDCRNL